MSEAPIQSPEVAALEAELQNGVRIETWMDSPIGRTVRERATAERTEVLEALANVDPEDARAVRALQNRIAVIDAIGQWLEEAMAAAKSAIARLEQLDQED